jgi:IS5 family transposase
MPSTAGFRINGGGLIFVVATQPTTVLGGALDLHLTRPRCPKAMTARSPMWTRRRAGPKKNGVSTYDYKGHIGVDEGTDLIRAATFTSADVHDSLEFKNLVSGDEHAVYADKGYPSEEHRAFLAKKGVKDGVMYKAVRGKPLKSPVGDQ